MNLITKGHIEVELFSGRIIAWMAVSVDLWMLERRNEVKRKSMQG
jgi:hypothetical protein